MLGVHPEAVMVSIDVLQPIEDRQVIRTGRFVGLSVLLAEYRRAVAAEELYDRLRAGTAIPGSRVPRAEIARAVFERLYGEPRGSIGALPPG
jgi:Flp pilus assembly protein CpaB